MTGFFVLLFKVFPVGSIEKPNDLLDSFTVDVLLDPQFEELLLLYTSLS